MRKRKILSIALSIEEYERLCRLAEHTQRSKNFYVREALNKYLDELEDIYLLERSIELVRAGEDELVDLEEARRELCSE